MEITPQEIITEKTMPRKGMLFSSYLKCAREDPGMYLTGRFPNYTGEIDRENALFKEPLEIESTFYRLLIINEPAAIEGHNSFVALPFRVMSTDEGTRPNIVYPEDFKHMLETVLNNYTKPTFRGEYRTTEVLTKDFEMLTKINSIKKKNIQGIIPILLKIVS